LGRDVGLFKSRGTKGRENSGKPVVSRPELNGGEGKEKEKYSKREETWGRYIL